MTILRIQVLLFLVPVHGFTHGWGSVGEMLAADIGTHSSARYDLSPAARPNWEWLANNYAAVTINGFGTLKNCDTLDKHGRWHHTGKWNCTGESTKTQAARILKGINPKIKVLWYQPSSAVAHGGCENMELWEHPEWWMRDDHGNIQPPGEELKCIPGNASASLALGCQVRADWRVKQARDWWVQAPLRQIVPQSDAASLVDGIFCDGSGYHNKNPAHISNATYEKLFNAKMQLLAEANAFYGNLSGGEVWGNPLIQYEDIGKKPPGSPSVSWNTTLAHYAGAFDEMFGSFSTLQGGFVLKPQSFMAEGLLGAQYVEKVTNYGFQGMLARRSWRWPWWVPRARGHR